MPDVHAKLSASSSHRWLTCTPSVNLEQPYPNKSSVFAQEGTLAHELGELGLRYNLKELTKAKYNAAVKVIKVDKLFTEDMPDYVERYVNTCMKKVAEAKSRDKFSIFKVEQRLDFSEWVPEGFGTGDFVIISDGTIEIIDLKYGKGVPVSAKDNPQMRLYALGALIEFDFVYEIQNIKMTIVQPRLDSISTDEISKEDILKWAEEFVKPKAELAMKGEGDFVAGEHCGFCRAKSVCKARADKNLELTKFEFRTTETLSDNDIAEVLGKVDELVKWASDIKDYALEQALLGVVYEGYKVVEGRSNRKYTDVSRIADILIANEFTEDKIYKPEELLALTKMESVVGKTKLNQLIGDYIEKPYGKPVLVSESDKRQPYNPAKADFQEV